MWDSSGCVRIGWYDRKEEEWRWDYVVPMLVGVKLPSDTSDGGQATPRGSEPQQESSRTPGLQPRPDGRGGAARGHCESAQGGGNSEAAKGMAGGKAQEMSAAAKKQITLVRSSTF